MPWGSEARGAVEQTAYDSDFDEIRGVIYLESGFDKHYDTVLEGFRSTEELRQRLLEIGEEQWYAYVPYDDGPVGTWQFASFSDSSRVRP